MIRQHVGKPTRRLWARMRGGEDDDIGLQRRAVLGLDAPTRPIFLNGSNKASAVLYRATVKQGLKLCCNVTPEIRAAGEDVPVRRRRLRIVLQGIGFEEPALEMLVVTGNQRHARGRHVDAVNGLGGIVGQAAAENGARFVDHDPCRPIRQKPGEMIGKRRPRKTATDDGSDGTQG